MRVINLLKKDARNTEILSLRRKRNGKQVRLVSGSAVSNIDIIDVETEDSSPLHFASICPSGEQTSLSVGEVSRAKSDL